MRVFISVDIEGVAGVSSRDDGNRGNPEYERARRLMTEEASAAVRGAFNADPDAEVTVADAHGSFTNIVPELLDQRARLMRGKPRSLAMIEGIQHGFDVALFIGYHGRAGTGESALSHTFTGTLADVRVNGRSFGEIGLNAAVAGHFRVPVGLVTGDTSVDAEVRDLLPSTSTVVVKRSVGQYAVDGVHPARAKTMIEQATTEVLTTGSAIAPFVVDGAVSLEVDLTIPAFADQAMIIPGIERTSGRSLAYTAPDYLTAYRVVRLIATLSTVPV